MFLANQSANDKIKAEGCEQRGENMEAIKETLKKIGFHLGKNMKEIQGVFENKFEKKLAEIWDTLVQEVWKYNF